MTRPHTCRPGSSPSSTIRPPCADSGRVTSKRARSFVRAPLLPLVPCRSCQGDGKGPRTGATDESLCLSRPWCGHLLLFIAVGGGRRVPEPGPRRERSFSGDVVLGRRGAAAPWPLGGCRDGLPPLARHRKRCSVARPRTPLTATSPYPSPPSFTAPRRTHSRRHPLLSRVALPPRSSPSACLAFSCCPAKCALPPYNLVDYASSHACLKD